MYRHSIYNNNDSNTNAKHKEIHTKTWTVTQMLHIRCHVLWSYFMALFYITHVAETLRTMCNIDDGWVLHSTKLYKNEYLQAYIPLFPEWTTTPVTLKENITLHVDNVVGNELNLGYNVS